MPGMVFVCHNAGRFADTFQGGNMEYNRPRREKCSPVYCRRDPPAVREPPTRGISSQIRRSLWMHQCTPLLVYFGAMICNLDRRSLDWWKDRFL